MTKLSHFIPYIKTIRIFWLCTTLWLCDKFDVVFLRKVKVKYLIKNLCGESIQEAPFTLNQTMFTKKKNLI